MAIESVPGTAIKYNLISFDAAGRERRDDPGGQMSELTRAQLQREGATDVFLLSHGWQGDVPAARFQYNKWIEAMAKCTTDIARLEQLRPGFKPLIVGLHWPSLAWGDEEFGAAGASFAAPTTDPAAALIEEYAARLGDNETVRAALATIVRAAAVEIAPATMPAEVREAFTILNEQIALESDGEGASPGADREPFDPERVYHATKEVASFGGFNLGGLLAPLRTLTFWKMKDRARSFGEGGGSDLLRSLQQAVGPAVRFHLMGHSFGCIAVSSILGGRGGMGSLTRPVHTLALVQGALSLWSYCSDIPHARGRKGYFRSVVAEGKVAGCIITTMSARDSAVGRFYPIGAGARGDVVFAPGTLPKYGGVGTFGARGPGLDLVDLPLTPAHEPYEFKPGKIYNLESSDIISQGGGFSGAHSDIAHPEVAHAFWSAAACEPAG